MLSSLMPIEFGGISGTVDTSGAVVASATLLLPYCCISCTWRHGSNLRLSDNEIVF